MKVTFIGGPADGIEMSFGPDSPLEAVLLPSETVLEGATYTLHNRGATEGDWDPVYVLKNSL